MLNRQLPESGFIYPNPLGIESDSQNSYVPFSMSYPRKGFKTINNRRTFCQNMIDFCGLSHNSPDAYCEAICGVTDFYDATAFQALDRTEYISSLARMAKQTRYKKPKLLLADKVIAQILNVPPTESHFAYYQAALPHIDQNELALMPYFKTIASSLNDQVALRKNLNVPFSYSDIKDINKTANIINHKFPGSKMTLPSDTIMTDLGCAENSLYQFEYFFWIMGRVGVLHHVVLDTLIMWQKICHALTDSIHQVHGMPTRF